MVEQGQVTGSREKIVLSWLLMASQLARLTSVPIPHLLPGGAELTFFRMNSVEPTMSAAWTVSIGHSR